jgi:EF hand
MKTQLVLMMALFATGVALADPAEDFARGNMNFDIQEMDANHDGRISKAEYMRYGETMWGRMSGNRDAVSLNEAAADFARGHTRFDATDMDADHDGSITKAEFMTYGESKWNAAKKDSDGTMSTADAGKYFATGNRAS